MMPLHKGFEVKVRIPQPSTLRDGDGDGDGDEYIHTRLWEVLLGDGWALLFELVVVTSF